MTMENQMIVLTEENAENVSTVININNPEWGCKKFSYNAQDLNDGEKCSIVGSGSNSKVLFSHEFKFWAVASWK
jgi:hypothetical protein